MRPDQLNSIDGRTIDTKKVKTESHIPFSDHLPDSVSSILSYEKRSGRDLDARKVLSSGSFDLADADTVLSGEAEGSPVISFFTNFYPDVDGNFSVYGEINTSDSDYYINSAVFIEGEGKVDEAREEFRDYAIPSEKSKYSESEKEREEV